MSQILFNINLTSELGMILTFLKRAVKKNESFCQIYQIILLMFQNYHIFDAKTNNCIAAAFIHVMCLTLD